MLFWISTILAGLVGLGVLHYWLKFRVWSSLGVPGPTPWPFVGNIPNLFMAKGSVHSMDMDWAAKYGAKGYWGYYSGTTPVLLIKDPELIREVMIKKFDSFPNRIEVAGLKFKYLDQDLARLRDDKWRRARNILSPTFTGSKLKGLVELINAIGRQLKLKFLHVSRQQEENDVELYTLFKHVTLDMICEIAFGTTVNSMENPDNPLCSACLKLSQSGDEFFKKPLTLLAVFFEPWGKIYRMYDPNIGLDFSYISVLESVVSSLYQQWKADRNTVQTHFLNTLFEQKELHEKTDGKEGISMESVIGNATIFLLAGFGTTANLMQWTCYYLAKHPEIQEKVVTEIRENIRDSASPVYEEVAKLEYLDNVLHEVLRFTPVFRVQRQAKEDTVLSNGLKIKKGWAIEIANMPLHMDEKIWGDPLAFRPERFSGEEAKTRSQFAFNAFGHGPRGCIGMRLALFEVKLALVSIFAEFELRVSSKTPEVLKMKKTGFVEPEKPLFVKVIKREE